RSSSSCLSSRVRRRSGTRCPHRRGLESLRHLPLLCLTFSSLSSHAVRMHIGFAHGEFHHRIGQRRCFIPPHFFALLTAGGGDARRERKRHGTANRHPQQTSTAPLR